MPSVHVYMGERAFDVFIESWPLGSLTTVPLALMVQGEGVVPLASVRFPVPHAKSLLSVDGNTGWPTVQFNPEPGTTSCPFRTACGLAEAG